MESAIGHPIFQERITVHLADFMGGDSQVVRSARVSTQGSGAASEAASEGLIRYLMRNDHSTPFESSVFTFIVHAPIFVTRQMLRHRIASWNEESGRYRELTPEFYALPEDRMVRQEGKTGDYDFVRDERLRAVADDHIIAASKEAWYHYESMLELGVAKEVARMVLPVNLFSTIYMTVNARSLMNFIRLRADHHAQHEIRMVADQMDAIFAQKMPITHSAFHDKEK